MTISTSSLGLGNKSMSQHEPPENMKKKKQMREDELMLRELADKIDYTSLKTIVEFNKRNKKGAQTDPHYKKQVLDPSSQLSADEIEALRMFLPFFLKQR